MSLLEERKEQLLMEIEKLHGRHELAKEIGPDFFEPGMMEYPEQSEGSWDEETGHMMCARYDDFATTW